MSELGYSAEVAALGEEEEVAPRPRFRLPPLACFAVMAFLGIAGGMAAVASLSTTGQLVQLPTRIPTSSPTTSFPTTSPTTSRPTVSPTLLPSASPTTVVPTLSPTTSPTQSPIPTPQPTTTPTTSPTKEPSKSPTESPTPFPSAQPSVSPTFAELTEAQLRNLIYTRTKVNHGQKNACTNCNQPGVSITVAGNTCVAAQNTGRTTCTNGIGGFQPAGVSDNNQQYFLSIDVNGAGLTCSTGTTGCASGTPEDQAIDALRYLCVAIGHRDECEGCQNAPTKHAQDCIDPSLSLTSSGNSQSGGLGTSIVPDGEVNDDDSFYYRFFVHPDAPDTNPLVIYAKEHCYIHMQYEDNCDNCPNGGSPGDGSSTLKGGRRFHNTATCSNLVGGGGVTCNNDYLVYDTDGAVDTNDMFWVRWQCLL